MSRLAPASPPTPAELPAGRASMSFIWSAIAPFLGLALVIGVFLVILPPNLRAGYLGAANLRTIAIQTVVVSLSALGMLLIIIAGGIDLSVGSLIALVGVVVALLIHKGFSVTSAVAAGLLVGAVGGYLNGLLITSLRITPFIITLGTLLIYRGVAQMLAHESAIYLTTEQARRAEWVRSLMRIEPEPSWLIVGPAVWIMVGLALLTAALLRYTVLGRYIFALGSNEATARLCGIDVPRTKWLVYTLAGLLTGLAGVMSFARSGIGNSTASIGQELDIIAAVVIGGGSLNGGQGSVLGTLIGAFIMVFLRNGCLLADIHEPATKVVIGAIIIAAVTLDQFRQRVGE